MSSAFRALAQPFLDAGLLAPEDVFAVALTAPRWGEDDPERMLGLAFAVRAPRLGHAGVRLAHAKVGVDVERRRFEERYAEAATIDDDGETPEDVAAPGDEEIPWPDAARWEATTLGSPMVGSGDQVDRPFVCQQTSLGSLLLTRRMHREQEVVAAALRRRANLPVPDHARLTRLETTLATLFDRETDGEAARAVRLAASRRLAIVIGGPGTGKTFSVTRLLAAILEEERPERPLTIKLAAPTGKAAARMREAVREALGDEKHTLAAPLRVKTALQALEATTLHRLLGMRPDGSARHGPENPMSADVVVVDEVSMVDLVLMRHLVEAVHEEARLVLIGDRDQLASVEAGCVLADLVGHGTDGPLAASVLAFTRSHRFETAPDIALVAACLQSYPTSLEDVPEEKAARDRRAVDVMFHRAHASKETHPGARVTRLQELVAAGEDQAGRPSEAELDVLAQPYTQGFEKLVAAGEKVMLPGYAALLVRHRLPSGEFSSATHEATFQREVLDALESYRVLAVHRRGPLGVTGLDRALSRRVRELLHPGGHRDGRRHWVGRPILVTENAPDLGLMNGDVGVVLPTKAGAAAVFRHESPGEVRVVGLSRLPPHEGALAMTVHKAQGSQFERVALVLAGRPSPIQTRELIYTAVTRARNQIVWRGTERELSDALDRPVERASGLDALLRQEPSRQPSRTESTRR
jgi:exodeoxyribonuclease V alpha subunit